MTVPVQNPIVAYVGNGITTVFAFPFRLLTEDDLTVTINGSPSPIAYTISGIGEDQGSVVFASAPTAGTRILLYRNVALMRSEDYQDNGDLLADTVNADFDRIWMALQGQGYLVGSGDPSLSRVLMLGRDDTNGSGAYRANSNRISDLADPIDNKDAVNVDAARAIAESFVPPGNGGGAAMTSGFVRPIVPFVNQLFLDRNLGPFGMPIYCYQVFPEIIWCSFAGVPV